MARRHPFTDADILAQIPEARRRAERTRAEGMQAVSAKYEPAHGRIVMETTTGYLFGIPVSEIAALRDASPAQLRQVELSPSGSGLHWEALDVDLDVAALIVSALRPEQRVRELARAAGSARSDRKAAAARANGAKGGRPAVRRYVDDAARPDAGVVGEPSGNYPSAGERNVKGRSRKK